MLFQIFRVVVHVNTRTRAHLEEFRDMLFEFRDGHLHVHTDDFLPRTV